MAVDFMICSASGISKSAKKLPPNLEFSSLGSAEDIRESVRKVFPESEWENEKYGGLEGDGYSLEFSIVGEGEVKMFTVYLHGMPPQSVLARLCAENDWVAFDEGGYFVQNRGVSL